MQVSGPARHSTAQRKDSSRVRLSCRACGVCHSIAKRYFRPWFPTLRDNYNWCAACVEAKSFVIIAAEQQACTCGRDCSPARGVLAVSRWQSQAWKRPWCPTVTPDLDVQYSVPATSVTSATRVLSLGVTGGWCRHSRLRLGVIRPAPGNICELTVEMHDHDLSLTLCHGSARLPAASSECFGLDLSSVARSRWLTSGRY